MSCHANLHSKLEYTGSDSNKEQGSKEEARKRTGRTLTKLTDAANDAVCLKTNWYQHKDLAVGRWGELSFLEQMANIGSEVERALNWKSKNNADYSRKAFERALELIDLTLENTESFARLKEIARTREAMVDYFFGTNQFRSTERSWRNYFLPFTYAARRNY